MTMLADFLGTILGARVVDDTGRSGDFAFAFSFEMPRPPADGASAETSAGEGPSIFTALREQLGLKLQTQKLAVEVLVIDSISRPDEN